jgi:hypothetical protein
MRNEHRLGVFQNKGLTKILRPQWDRRLEEMAGIMASFMICIPHQIFGR